MHPPPSARATILLIGGVAATTAGVSLFTINRLKDVVVGAVLRDQPVSLSPLLGRFGILDAALVLLTLAAGLALVRSEYRHAAVSTLLRTATPRQALELLTILAAWFGHGYLNPGVLLGGDTATHVARFLEIARGFSAGELAQWSNYQYAGAPLIWFTGPFTYVVGGALAFLLRDALAATKRCCSRCTCSRPGSVSAGCADWACVRSQARLPRPDSPARLRTFICSSTAA